MSASRTEVNRVNGLELAMARVMKERASCAERVSVLRASASALSAQLGAGPPGKGILHGHGSRKRRQLVLEMDQVVAERVACAAKMKALWVQGTEITRQMDRTRVGEETQPPTPPRTLLSWSRTSLQHA